MSLLLFVMAASSSAAAVADGTASSLVPLLGGLAYIASEFADAVWTPDQPPIPELRPGGGKCTWSQVTYGTDHRRLPICLVNKDDHISKTIIKTGHWFDCRLLRRLWHAPIADGTHGGLFLEIGANIGACTAEFLRYTDASIIAVEPNPFNLYHLTRTLHAAAKMNASMASRVVVVALGLGDELIRDAIVQWPNGNAGNSAIVVERRRRLLEASLATGRELQEQLWQRQQRQPQQQLQLGEQQQQQQQRQLQQLAVAASPADDVQPPQHTRIAPLDVVFPNGALPSRVRLVKVDTEGFECRVLHGAHRLLRSGKVARLTTEIENPWSRIQSRMNCSLSIVERELGKGKHYTTMLRKTMSENTLIAQSVGEPQVHCEGVAGCNNLPADFYYNL